VIRNKHRGGGRIFSRGVLKNIAARKAIFEIAISGCKIIMKNFIYKS